jgi:hypothetical protein
MSDISFDTPAAQNLVLSICLRKISADEFEAETLSPTRKAEPELDGDSFG